MGLKEKEAQLKGSMTEKDAKKDEKSKKGDEKEIAKLRDDIEAYKLKLKEEFGTRSRTSTRIRTWSRCRRATRDWAASEFERRQAHLTECPPFSRRRSNV